MFGKKNIYLDWFQHIILFSCIAQNPSFSTYNDLIGFYFYYFFFMPCLGLLFFFIFFILFFFLIVILKQFLFSVFFLLPIRFIFVLDLLLENYFVLLLFFHWWRQWWQYCENSVVNLSNLFAFPAFNDMFIIFNFDTLALKCSTSFQNMGSTYLIGAYPSLAFP